MLDPLYPKVPPEDVERLVESAGCVVEPRNPDVTVVVGGDGLFSMAGRIESSPLLFVGTKSKQANGTLAILSEIVYDDLRDALVDISGNRYKTFEAPRLEVLKNGVPLGDVFTDVYLQRGIEPSSLRYTVVSNMGDVSIIEHAIGDGIIVTTRAGSTGYYSYLDKIGYGFQLEPEKYGLIGEDDIGICHIVPNFIKREETEEKPLRYTVPLSSLITVKLDRKGAAYLYGLGDPVPVSVDDIVVLKRSPRVTRLLKRAF